MTVQQEIEDYIAAQTEPKRGELQDLHRLILRTAPHCRLWFLDGRNADGKIVSNPNIGYGSQEMKYAGGETRDFYRLGLSANTTGISVYVMDTEDKSYLAKTYGDKLGKAKITGYCVKFRSTRDVDADCLEAMISDCMGREPARGVLLP